MFILFIQFNLGIVMTTNKTEVDDLASRLDDALYEWEVEMGV